MSGGFAREVGKCYRARGHEFVEDETGLKECIKCGETVSTD
ncbi:MAG: hypothetical protein ABEJ56_00600 [Candidatus Nanohaloarchaea archaeon]